MPMLGRLSILVLGLVLGACATRPAVEGAAGSQAHVDAMAREHAGHTPVTNEATMDPRTPVVAQEVEYSVDGARVRGYEARPAGAAANASLPSVVVIHEWWGLNDNVHMMARRLAGEGYRVLAVDMYEGQVAQSPEQARTLMQGVMQNPSRGVAHLAGAVRSLEERTGAQRIGIMGWCFGGAWALQGALNLPDKFDAAVMYYGRVVTGREQLARLRAPLLGLFGAEDQGIPVDQVRQMEATLRDLGKDATIQIYPGAGHAFANPSGQAYKAEVAGDAWMRTTAHFGRHLR
jgi:carboxymethylenebutenolidase